MAVNKVQYGNQTIMDITDTSANDTDVVAGEVYYNSRGVRSVGTLGDATQFSHGLMSAADKAKLDGFTNSGEINLNNPQFTGSLNLGRAENTAVGSNSTALGYNVQARGSYSVAEGTNTIAQGSASHAEGSNTTAYSINSHAEGLGTIAQGNNSHAEGNNTAAYGESSSATGYYTVASSRNEHVSGTYNALEASNWTANTAYEVNDAVLYNGQYFICTQAHTSTDLFNYSNWQHTTKYLAVVGNGIINNRSNAYALDENGNIYINGEVFIRCDANSANGTKLTDMIKVGGEIFDPAFLHSISMGRLDNTEIGQNSIAFGNNVTAEANYSFAQGVQTIANAPGSHAEGYHTTAYGMYDHTTGMFNAQQAPYWEEGTSYNVGDMCTILSWLVKCKTAHTSTWFFEEEYWEPVINYLEVVGNGTDAEHLSNARVLDLLGNERLKGTLYIGCNADSTGGTEVAPKVNATQQAAGLMSAADKIKLDALDNNFSSKADKVTAATNGNFAGLDATGNLIDSGHKHSDYLTQHQDISGKADKVTSATNGNFAALDSNGNLTDSGHKHSDYLTQHQDISGKVNGPASSTDGHIAVFDGATGKTIKDSGYTIATSVPANAIFTDTTYSTASAIADGLMSATDKSKLDSIAQGATANLGTVTRIASGTGLTGGPITGSGTLKANLRSETGLNGDSVAATETTGRIYPIVIDNSGYLAVVVPWTNTTYNAATQTDAGLMSAADKTKLNGLNLKSSNSLLNSAGAIEEYSNRIFAVVPDANGKLAVVVPYTNYSAGAGITETVYNEGTYYNSSLNYTYYTQGYTVFTLNLISNTPYSNAAQDTTEVANRVYGVKLDANNKLSVNVPWTDTTYSNATTSAAGLMSAEDKTKLDGITSGATSGTYSNLAAAQNGTDVSLVTTGEKYIWNHKADANNPIFTGSISCGRRSGETIGTNSFAYGTDVVSTGQYSFSMGWFARATAGQAAAFGYISLAAGSTSFAAGSNIDAYGESSQAMGCLTCAQGKYECVTGYGNIYEGTEWTKNTYYSVGDKCRRNWCIYECIEDHLSSTEITTSDTTKWKKSTYFLEAVGNGYWTLNDDFVRSNARSLDWNGNEYLMGDLYVNCTKDVTGGKKVMANGDSSITIGSTTITESQLQQLLAMLT